MVFLRRRSTSGVGAKLLWSFACRMQESIGTDAQDARTETLHKELMAYYSANDPPAKFYKLCFTMIQKTSATPPKLRGKAAEVRGAVPFVKAVAERYLTSDDEVERAARRIAQELAAMYECLSSQQAFAADLLAQRSRRVCSLWVALERVSPAPRWRVKPKMHLLQELAEMQIGSQPARTWTYRDEEFGGSMAALARKRGGAHTPEAVSRAVLLRFVTREPVPRLR